MDLGTHYGSSHELEVRWAELVCELTPCAERVRFTASGTEASHMAIRLARAYTGKDKIVRFIGHFHGWHDNVTAGAGATYDGGTTPGVPQEVSALSIVMPSDNVAAVVKLIEERDDIAAVMFEPSGASWGQAPLPPGFIQAVRDATKKKGVVMMMDEVITGYRWSSGGAQKAFGITPDLCILAKIVAGGLPGGAVAGKREILDLIDHAATTAAKREKIAHPGTFNANPLSAAAAVTQSPIRLAKGGWLSAMERKRGSFVWDSSVSVIGLPPVRGSSSVARSITKRAERHRQASLASRVLPPPHYPSEPCRTAVHSSPRSSKAAEANAHDCSGNRDFGMRERETSTETCA